jgi:hypothetical protein
VCHVIASWAMTMACIIARNSHGGELGCMLLTPSFCMAIGFYSQTKPVSIGVFIHGKCAHATYSISGMWHRVLQTNDKTALKQATRDAHTTSPLRCAASHYNSIAVS